MSLFYGEEGRERLMCDPEEVVMEVFDDLETIENFEHPFIVKEFKPMEIELSAKWVVEEILEKLDDELGDPDGDYTQPTEAMIKSAEALVETIKKEYHVWMCEPTGNKIEYSQEDVLRIVGRE